MRWGSPETSHRTFRLERGRLTDLAREIRCRLREVAGKPALDTDRPLAADIREAGRIADRVARRLAEHHPDPEVRRIYRQLVEHVESKREERA